MKVVAFRRPVVGAFKFVYEKIDEMCKAYTLAVQLKERLSVLEKPIKVLSQDDVDNIPVTPRLLGNLHELSVCVEKICKRGTIKRFLFGATDHEELSKFNGLIDSCVMDLNLLIALANEKRAQYELFALKQESWT